MNLKPWLYAMLSALLSWQAVAESRTGYVDGDNPNANAYFYTVYDTSYTLAASPQNGWIFYDYFIYTTSNGWYHSGGYSISCERISGVTTVFVDAASAFSATMEGTMYKPGGSGGSPVAWSVTGMSAASNTQYAVDPATAVIPFGETKVFTYNVNGYAAPSGMWKYTPGQTSYTGSSATYTFPSAPLIAGIYTLTAARNSNGAQARSADIRYVEVASVSATYGSTTVISTTNSPEGAQTLCVPKGASAFDVTATMNPSGLRPDGFPKWKKDSGDFTNAGITTYSFNPTTVGTYTIAAFCGASRSKAIKIFVWEVISETVATSPSNRTRKTVGVGEEVNLSTNPLISVAWSVTGGGSVSSANGTTTKFTAGDRNATSVVKATINSNDLLTTFSVIEPNGIVILQKPGTNVAHEYGVPSVGFKGLLYVQPATVSFYNIFCKEGADNAVANGYFTYQNGLTHPMGTWIHATNTVSVNGTLVGEDTIQGGTDSHTPYIDGTFSWSIPLYFKVGSGEEKHFTTVKHEKTIDPTGKMTISKGGTIKSANLNDPTSSY